MPYKPTPLCERIMRRLRSTTSGCWEWTGALNPAGYGVIGRGPRGSGNVLTHRATYEHLVGAVPPGLDLDHLCRNRACCNPAHLEPVTRQVNVARGARRTGWALAGRTHCPHGHPYTPENTLWRPKQRRCRTCVTEYGRRIRAARKNRVDQ